MNRTKILTSLVLLAAFVGCAKPSPSQTQNIYDSIGKEIFEKIETGHFTGSDAMDSASRACSLDILPNGNKRPKFRFTYFPNKSNKSETVTIDGENFSGTLGYTLMSGMFKSYEVVTMPIFDQKTGQPIERKNGFYVQSLTIDVNCEFNERQQN